MDEGATLYRCALCDSYALLTLGLLPDRKLARGIKGKKAYEDLLEDFQERLAPVHKTFLLACVTCNAFASASDPEKGFDQVKQGEYLRDGLAVLTPCDLVVFDDQELPPVYRDEASEGGKPKWRLAQGVGPAGLELDRTRTGRLFKPSLRPFGIDVTPLNLPGYLANDRDALAVAVREACAFAEATMEGQPENADLVNEPEFDETRITETRNRNERSGSKTLRAWRDVTCGGRPVLQTWNEARSAAIAMSPDTTKARMEQAAKDKGE